MPHTPPAVASSAPSRKPYRGSMLLDSGARRVLRVLPCIAVLWGLTAWAMGWLGG